MKIAGFVLCLAVALVAGPTLALADVIGPILPRGAMQLGIQQQWSEREVYYGSREMDVKHNEAFGVLRWGITQFATISLEGVFGTNPDAGEDLDTEYFYLIGGGVQATLWKHPRATITGGYQLTESFYRLVDHANLTTETHNAQLLVQAGSDIRGHHLIGWAGPAFSKYYLTQNQTLQSGYVPFYTDSNWGGVIGFDLLLWSHIDLTSCVLWVENPQPRVALYYRF